MIGALGKVTGLKVPGRTSAFALKGRALGARAIGDMLGVATVLEGSVRRAGRRLRVSAQLISAADDRVLWAESYDRELADIFAVQEEIAQAIVSALRVQFERAAGASPRLVPAGPANLEAYELFLKGLFVGRRMKPEDLHRAIAYFEQSIACDPAYARPYAALADARVLLVVFAGRSTRSELPRARAYAEKAVALDPTLADGHWALGHVLFALEFDLASAIREMQRALALDPRHVDSRHLYAILLLDLDRFEEAAAELTRTLATDPLFAAASMTFGYLHLVLGHDDRAISYFREALTLAPDFSYARCGLGHAYLQAGRPGEALAEFERAVVTGTARDRAQLAYAYAITGQRTEATVLLREVLAPEGDFSPPLLQVAMAYVGLGDADEAFRWLERATEEHDPHVLGLNIFPAFRPLRSDPRFDILVRRLGLVE